VDTTKSSASAHHPPDDQDRRDCFACYEGVVYLGELVEGHDGEEVEVYTAHACRLCGGAGQISR
jgi:hypothetical protein